MRVIIEDDSQSQPDAVVLTARIPVDPEDRDRRKVGRVIQTLLDLGAEICDVDGRPSAVTWLVTPTPRSRPR